MDDRDFFYSLPKVTNQFLPDAQSSLVPGRVAPPMSDTSVPPVSVRPPVVPDRAVPPLPSRAVPPLPSRAVPPVPDRTSRPMHPATNATYNVPRTVRRVPIPVQQQYMPSTVNSAYPSGAYPFHHPGRPYMNMNMGGLNSGYNSFGAYGQPMANQFQNPMVVAAAENYRPTFDSIQDVVQVFHSISMLLDSTLNAMQVTFQTILGVAENYARVKMVLSKLYSLIVSVKLIKWFLTNMFNLLRMVRGGGRGSSAEENLWNAISTTQENVPSDGRSWPLVVFTGILCATPFFINKLLNSGGTPIVSNSVTRTVSNTLPMHNNKSEVLGLLVKASFDWSSSDRGIMPLVNGEYYFTSRSRIAQAERNGGWLLLNDRNGQSGFAPLNLFKLHTIASSSPQNRSQERSTFESAFNQLGVISESEQMQSQSLTTPNPIVCDNSVVPPQQLVDCDSDIKSSNGYKTTK